MPLGSGAYTPSGPLMSLPSADLRDFRLAPREWLFFAAVILFWAGFVILLGKDTSWDFRNYHWYAPYALLNHRMGIDVAVAHQASYYNPFLDIPFYLAGHPHPVLDRAGRAGRGAGRQCRAALSDRARRASAHRRLPIWAPARWRCWGRSAASPSPSSAPPITTM